MCNLAKNCTNRKIYSECGPACSYSCDLGAGAVALCKETCIDGCHCPPHTSLLGDKCVPTGECPCEHNGIQYDHGNTVNMGCDKWLVYMSYHICFSNVVCYLI